MRMVFLCLGLLLWGCAIAQQVKVSSEVIDATNAKKRSVAVVADLYMEDAAEADKLAELMRSQLTAKGFDVRATENEAELIVISTVERSQSIESSMKPRETAWRSFDLPYGVGQANMMQSQNALRNLGFEFDSAAPEEERRVGLMVTAVTRQAWSNAPLDEKTEIPRVWRIIAVTRLGKGDVTPKLIEAVGSKLSEVSGGKREPQGVRSTGGPAG